MGKSRVYVSDPHAAPDSDFVPGELRHLVVGNRGRLLDARRTPVSVVAVAAERGAFVVRIEAFEDAGVHWELWLREIERFQFTRDATIAGASLISGLEKGIERFDRDLVIGVDRRRRQESLKCLAQRRMRVREWLRDRSAPPPIDLQERVERRAGSLALFALLDEFLAEHGAVELEERFTAAFVTNPRSGETVKGHAIVLAELGLCPYHGKVPRDPSLFTGTGSRPRRADHLLWRLAFVHGLLAGLGASDLTSPTLTSKADQPLRPQSYGGSRCRSTGRS